MSLKVSELRSHRRGTAKACEPSGSMVLRMLSKEKESIDGSASFSKSSSCARNQHSIPRFLFSFLLCKNHENKIERTSWIGDATLEEAGPGL